MIEPNTPFGNCRRPVLNHSKRAITATRRIVHRCDQLRQISAHKDTYFRAYLTTEHRLAAELIMAWMNTAGLSARMDPAGNVVGRLEGVKPGMPAVVMGSHFDTVRDAGRFDGVLGITTAIECVQTCRDLQRSFPFSLEVYAFADEEGARFPISFIGSRAVTGTLKEEDLSKSDADGVALTQALIEFGFNPARITEATRHSNELLAYLELHIEQGPRLQAENLSVCAVSGIQGQTFATCVLKGRAGHAGTVPMQLRRDALAGAAEAVLTVEKTTRAEPEVVATVGRLTVSPGAANVIPGQVIFSVDLRSPSDTKRKTAWQKIRESAEGIAKHRHLDIEIVPIMDQAAVSTDPRLTDIVAEACGEVTGRPFTMTSGAGHDAEIFSRLCPVTMIFVRCKDGISHHPAENVALDDVADGYRALLLTIEKLAATF